MAKLTRDDILQLAELSRLSLSEEEITSYIDDLSKILDYVEQLQNTDVRGLEPSYQVTGLSSVMRKDEIKNYGYDQRALLKNLPASEDGQIKVKRVLA